MVPQDVDPIFYWFVAAVFLPCLVGIFIVFVGIAYEILRAIHHKLLDRKRNSR